MAQQTRKQTEKPITAAQIKRIHTIVHILKISDENYRAALDSRFGVASCKDLTLSQAHSFIDELEKLAIEAQGERYKAKREAAEQKAEDEKPKRFDNLNGRDGMASAAQLRKIEAMWTDISVISDQDARNRALRHFVQRIAGVAALRFLDLEGTSKVINALSAMLKRSADNPEKSPTRKKGRKTD